MTKTHRLSLHLYSSEERRSFESSWPFASIQISTSGILVSAPPFRYQIAAESITDIDWRRSILIEVRIRFLKAGHYDRLRLHSIRGERLIMDLSEASFDQKPNHDPELPILWDFSE